MAGYSKEFLVDAFLHRYDEVLATQDLEKATAYCDMISTFYDAVGRDKFRVWCSLDAEALRKFKLETGRKS